MTAGDASDRFCACGQHQTMLLWSGATRRAASEALASCHYGEWDKATGYLQEITDQIPETCDTLLIRQLRAWRETSCPRAYVFALARSVYADAEAAKQHEMT